MAHSTFKELGGYVLRGLAMGLLAAGATACVASAQDAEDTEQVDDALVLETPRHVTLPAGGMLTAATKQIGSDLNLLSAVQNNDGVYIQVGTGTSSVWYYKTGNYLLGVESFTLYALNGLEFNKVTFGSGTSAAPMQARLVAYKDANTGWNIHPTASKPFLWPPSANSVWIHGTDTGILAMSGSPQGVPLGTEVFGSTQTYGSKPSTWHLRQDVSTEADSARIQGMFTFDQTTILGGHSAGSSAARKIALDLGLTHVWLYGTPNYGRTSPAYKVNESHGAVVEVINNAGDPVTNCLLEPWKLVSLAWGTAACHRYNNWAYEATSTNAAPANCNSGTN